MKRRNSAPLEWWVRYQERMRRGKFRIFKTDVAEAAGISYSQLGRWLRGKGEPTISQAAGMVMLVDASLDEIFIPDEKAKKAVLKRIEEKRRQ